MSVFIMFVCGFFISVSSVKAKDILMPLDKLQINAQPVLTQDDFSLFPVENSIPDFPEPIDMMETDLSILVAYYSELAATYGAWGKAHLEKVHELSKVIHHARTQLHTASLKQGYRNVNHSSKMIENQYKAGMTQVGYQVSHHKEIAYRSLKKQEFYQELAQTCQEVHPSKSERK